MEHKISMYFIFKDQFFSMHHDLYYVSKITIRNYAKFIGYRNNFKKLIENFQITKKKERKEKKNRIKLLVLYSALRNISYLNHFDKTKYFIFIV